MQPLATMLICERSASIGTSTKGGAIVVQTGVREDRLTDADPLGPVDPLENVRRLGLAPILTSEGLGWRGIKAERFRHSLREIEQPPFENHLITLFNGDPGTPQYINGVSYWVADPTARQRMVAPTVE